MNAIMISSKVRQWRCCSGLPSKTLNLPNSFRPMIGRRFMTACTETGQRVKRNSRLMLLSTANQLKQSLAREMVDLIQVSKRMTSSLAGIDPRRGPFTMGTYRTVTGPRASLKRSHHAFHSSKRYRCGLSRSDRTEKRTKAIEIIKRNQKGLAKLPRQRMAWDESASVKRLCRQNHKTSSKSP